MKLVAVYQPVWPIDMEVDEYQSARDSDNMQKKNINWYSSEATTMLD